MQKARLHLIATVLVTTSALAVAGCAAAAIPGDDQPGDATVSVGAPPGESAEVGGHTVSTADGYAADGAPISEIADTPAIANLDGDLRNAVTRATEAAAADGVEVRINSGWRSKRYQQALLDQGVEEHGSLEEARRWVNTSDRSTHVQGRAVDIGAIDAAAWMQEHGNEFGLCQIYDNEAWHYELATKPGGECPRKLFDSSAG